MPTRSRGAADTPTAIELRIHRRRLDVEAFYPFELLGQSAPVGCDFLECGSHRRVRRFSCTLPSRDPTAPVLFWAGMHDAASFIHDLRQDLMDRQSARRRLLNRSQEIEQR